MSRVLELVHEARRTGDWAPLVAAIPYARFLGLSVVDDTAELVTKLTYQPSLIGNPAVPALHGGTVGALLESAAIFEVLASQESVVIPKMITVTIDYLRSAKPTDTFAKGVVTKQGRRVVTVRVTAWQDDRSRPVASANAHLLLTPPEGDGDARGGPQPR